MLDFDDLTTMSNQHINDCFFDYRNTKPCHVGQLVDLHDDDGRLDAICRVLGLYWSEREYDWLVLVEIFERGELIKQTVSGAYITVHHGFCGRAI